jgi:hypothetical protein
MQDMESLVQTALERSIALGMKNPRASACIKGGRKCVEISFAGANLNFVKAVHSAVQVKAIAMRKPVVTRVLPGNLSICEQ